MSVQGTNGKMCVWGQRRHIRKEDARMVGGRFLLWVSGYMYNYYSVSVQVMLLLSDSFQSLLSRGRHRATSVLFEMQ